MLVSFTFFLPVFIVLGDVRYMSNISMSNILESQGIIRVTVFSLGRPYYFNFFRKAALRFCLVHSLIPWPILNCYEQLSSVLKALCLLEWFEIPIQYFWLISSINKNIRNKYFHFVYIATLKQVHFVVVYFSCFCLPVNEIILKMKAFSVNLNYNRW